MGRDIARSGHTRFCRAAAVWVEMPRVVTARERQILELFARGLTYAEAGQVLGISTNTIRDHVRALYRKLDVSSKVEAVLKIAALSDET
jgi:DNA-binding CsgD family transcriptional regulator